MSHSKQNLLLASASPRRKELLARLGVEFEVMVAPVVEHEEATAEPRWMVLHNAALKAAWVCARRPGAWVLAADTIVALDNLVLNKPRDLAEARAMLQKLSGRTHTVYTGVCLWRRPGGPEISHCETSEVTFRVLDDATITRYFALVNPLDKAGAYGIQEGRELILESYTGSLANIMGLPIEWLAAQLHGLALRPTPDAPIIADSHFHARARPTSAPPARPA
ncbi:MAG TPA: nucleoside triphosphate pyrophosphatase [Opitutales bacterium]|nr:nucleoside triphosphate pyrophosphatase [Opitutales bacterium]